MKDQLLHRANFERPLITENQTGKYLGLVMVKPCFKLKFYCLFGAKIQQILNSKHNVLLFDLDLWPKIVTYDPSIAKF